ncbi:hypothetical protein PROFUN_09536 [Planoprotostelium fungivorum]|uniref:Uncharacterized protein n=1 Tax=Planoprotostelium fungivorum TaxID=1890364 RepID=A0A2P6MT13_9EUKA|nr:hypothetical protein PROFUN_09536 [Planoprotostelium fungivorum]
MGNEVSTNTSRSNTAVRRPTGSNAGKSNWNNLSDEDFLNQEIQGRELQETPNRHSGGLTETTEVTESVAPTLEIRSEIIMHGWLQKQTMIHLSRSGETNTTPPTGAIPKSPTDRTSSRKNIPSVVALNDSEEGTTPPSTNSLGGPSAMSSRNIFTMAQSMAYTGTSIVKAVARGYTNNSPWQNRFFVLSGGILYYYSSKVEEKLSGTEDMKATFPDRTPSRLQGLTKVGYIFQLEWASKNTTIQLSAATLPEVDDWMHFLHNMSPSSEKNGVIYYYHQLSKRWMERWIHIKGGSIELSSRLEKGTFPLHTASVQIPDNVNSSTGFTFTVSDSTKILNLSAESQEVRTKWMEAIHREIDYLSKASMNNLTDRISMELATKINAILDKHKIETEMLQLNEEAKREDKMNRDIPSVDEAPDDKTKPLFVLSIDGGGMRGIITTIILTRIIERYPDFMEKIDVVAGCSNGGMVAMAIAFGYHPKFCHYMLEVTGETIFKTGVLSQPLNSAKFRNTHLKLLCDLIWEKRKMSAAKKRVLIPAFLMDNRSTELRRCEPKVFHNFDSEHEEELASDVVMRTISAPTFFPSYQGFVDGGIFAHDPSSQVLSFILSPKRMSRSPRDIFMLSLGTGKVFNYYESNGDPPHDWGYVQWLPKLPACIW